jgi:hypothetical protein
MLVHLKVFQAILMILMTATPAKTYPATVVQAEEAMEAEESLLVRTILLSPLNQFKVQ